MKQAWMKPVLVGLLVGAARVCVSMETAPAEEPNAQTDDRSVADVAEPTFFVDLVDGSRIVGAPSAKRLTVTSLVGNVRVPFTSIERVVY